LKIVRRIFALLWQLIRIIMLLILMVLILPALMYILPAYYHFPPPMRFAGDKWYNPYQTADKNHWQLANFHMHSRAWGGLTDGAENKDHQVYDTYRKNGFGSVSISNYQSINKLYKDSAFYIPAYEHGYGIYKNHHLCLGAHKVIWYDLPYGQTIHHKQYIINRLRPTTEIISINHPSFFKGFKPEDFTKLTGYDFIETLNGFRNSVPHWDSALSAGRPALILANDDMHDINNVDEIGRRFTVINSPTNSRADIVASLKSGNAFGVYYQGEEGETLHQKNRQFALLPVVESVSITGDSLTVKLDTSAFEVRFFGQGGQLLQKDNHVKRASYKLKPDDTFVRIVLLFPTRTNTEGLQFFLNPVMRSADGSLPAMPVVKVDLVKTWFSRIGLSILAIGLFWIVLRLRRRRRKKIQA